MANKKISELNELVSPLSGDTLPIVNGGETMKITVNKLLSGSNVHPYFIATDGETTENYKVGDSTWLGDIGMANTLLVKGVQDSGSAYIKFGNSDTGHNPYIGHDSNEDANVFSIYATTTKITGSLIIGNGTLQSGNPELLHVLSSGSFNIAHFIGDSETYSQIKVKNINDTSGASTDLVLEANNGDENNHYVNLGINSSGWLFQTSSIGYQNDAYLYNVGQDLYIGSMEPASPNHGHVHIFASSSWENPEINVLSDHKVGFNTSSVVDGFNFEFSGSAQFDHDLKVNGQVIGSGSLLLKPDELDSRYVQIYNTAPSDIHIKGNAALTYFGDDTNYVKIDANAETVTINATSRTTINTILNLGQVSELPTGSIIGDLVVSGSNIYFHNGSSWNLINITSI